MTDAQQLIQDIQQLFPDLTHEQQEQFLQYIKKLQQQKPNIHLDTNYKAQLLRKLQIKFSQQQRRKQEGVIGRMRHYRTSLNLVPLLAICLILARQRQPQTKQKTFTIPLAPAEEVQNKNPKKESANSELGTMQAEEQNQEGEDEVFKQAPLPTQARSMPTPPDNPTPAIEQLIEITDTLADEKETEIIVENSNMNENYKIGEAEPEIFLADDMPPETDIMVLGAEDETEADKKGKEEVVIPATSTLLQYISFINASSYDNAYALLDPAQQGIYAQISNYESTAENREHITANIIDNYELTETDRTYNFVTLSLTTDFTDGTSSTVIYVYTLRKSTKTDSSLRRLYEVE